MIRYTKHICVLLLIVLQACAGDSLEQYQKEADSVPVLGAVDSELSGYTLRVTGAVINNGGGEILETGVCYNLAADGTPMHSNGKSKVIPALGLDHSFKQEIMLMPEKEYTVCTYALNSKGVAYSEPVNIVTGKIDYTILLPGTYRATKQYAYHTQAEYDDYMVTISYENGQFLVHGLGCSPDLEWDASAVKLRLEANHVVTDTTDYHQINIPMQMVGQLKDEFVNPVLCLSSGWMINGDSTDPKDITGVITTEDEVVLWLETGYCFAYCDPITHEINVDEVPIELIYGPGCFPDKTEEELAKLPKCKLVKVN